MVKHYKKQTNILHSGCVKLTLLFVSMCFALFVSAGFGISVLSRKNINSNQTFSSAVQPKTNTLGQTAEKPVITAEIYDEDGNLLDFSGINDTKQMQASGYAATATAVTNTNGGLLQITKGTYTMNSGTISGVSAVNGGAVYIGSGATFILNGGSIENCSAENGGAIYVDKGGKLIVTGGSITGCHATAANGRGGAIYINTGEDTYISGLTMADCTAEQYGGAIYNLTGNICNITKNVKISNCTAQKGSAMYFNRGDVTFYGGIVNCQTTNVDNGNGTIYVGNNVNLVLGANTSIASNTATRGAGVYIGDTARVTMNEGALIDNCNSTRQGGAFYLSGDEYVNSNSEDTNTLTINGGTISNCTCGAEGGAIYATGSAKLTMISGLIDKCSTGSQGGAVKIAAASQFNMQGGTISNCMVLNSQGQIADGGRGGAVYVSSYFNISGGLIEKCGAGEGGAVFSSSWEVSMTGGSISDCMATERGGGISAISGSKGIHGGTIIGCRAGNNGGGIYSGGSSISVGCSIKGCYTTYSGSDSSFGNGGGIYADNGLILAGATIEDCHTKYNGGGVYLNNTGSFMGCNILGCGTTDSSGGGVFAVKGTKLYFGNYRNEFARCQANYKGGAIHLSSGCIADIHDIMITTCTATEGGGGIDLYNGAILNLYGGNIDRCRANNSGGAIRLSNYSKLNMYGGYIGSGSSVATSASYSNYATYGGGIFLTSGSEAYLSGGSVLRNYAAERGGGIYVDIDNSNPSLYQTKLVVNGATIQYNGAQIGGGISNENKVYLASGVLKNNRAYYSTIAGNDGYNECWSGYDSSWFYISSNMTLSFSADSFWDIDYSKYFFGAENFNVPWDGNLNILSATSIGFASQDKNMDAVLAPQTNLTEQPKAEENCPSNLDNDTAKVSPLSALNLSNMPGEQQGKQYVQVCDLPKDKQGEYALAVDFYGDDDKESA